MGPGVRITYWKAASVTSLVPVRNSDYSPNSRQERDGRKKWEVAGSTQEVTPESAVGDSGQVTDHGAKEKTGPHTSMEFSTHGPCPLAKHVVTDTLGRTRKEVNSWAEAQEEERAPPVTSQF